MAESSLDFPKNSICLFGTLIPEEKTSDLLLKDMDSNDTEIEKEMALNSTMDLGMTADTEILKDITDYLGKINKVDPKCLPGHSSQPEIAQVIHIRSFKSDAVSSKELSEKLKCMIEENSSNSLEKDQLTRDVIDCIRKERKRKQKKRIVGLKGSKGQLKRIWGSDVGDEECVELAASEKVFDLSSLNQSLPCEPDDNDRKKKAKKLAKEYMAFAKKKRRSFRKSEIIRILNSKASEMNNNSSSKHRQPRSITHMVKKVCGDVKNFHIFSFRPLLKAQKDSDSSMDCKGVSCPKLHEVPSSHKERNEKVQNLCEGKKLQAQSKKLNYKVGKETLVLLKSPYTNMSERNGDEQKCKNEDSKTANNLQNFDRLLFNRNQSDDEKHRTLRTQQLHDSVSLCRQLSRLNLANSRRGDLLEDVKESEMAGASTDQNKGEQEKVAVANRRREIVERLREGYRKHKQHEAEALKKN